MKTDWLCSRVETFSINQHIIIIIIILYGSAVCVCLCVCAGAGRVSKCPLSSSQRCIVPKWRSHSSMSPLRFRHVEWARLLREKRGYAYIGWGTCRLCSKPQWRKRHFLHAPIFENTTRKKTPPMCAAWLHFMLDLRKIGHWEYTFGWWNQNNGNGVLSSPWCGFLLVRGQSLTFLAMAIIAKNMVPQNSSSLVVKLRCVDETLSWKQTIPLY